MTEIERIIHTSVIGNLCRLHSIDIRNETKDLGKAIELHVIKARILEHQELCNICETCKMEVVKNICPRLAELKKGIE